MINTQDPETVKRAQPVNRPGNSIFREWRGPLTEKLLRDPAQYGLGQLPANRKPDATTQMICGFCSTGCSLKIHLKEGEAINLSPDTHYPVNLGMACPKGWEALTPLQANDRATKPYLRNEQDELEAVSWESALTEFTTRFKAIQERHGKESVAFLSTGQIVCEEMAMLGALAKFGMGMRHGDGNTRQCMATSVVSYKQSFGFDAPPYTYQDFEESDVIVLIGSNLCIAHPIMWQRVMRNRNNPKIVVIDPRRTETANAATHHYPIAPKSDLVFFYGLANILIEKGWIDEKFIEASTVEFAAFKEFIAKYTTDYVAQESGISGDDLLALAQMIHEGKRVSFWWTMGVNQSYEGVRVAQSIINLALMTGNIGKPGTGANSITGQCNAMGSRLFSNTTNLLGGHDFLNESHREKVAGILGIDASLIPDQNSLPYHKIIEGIDKGEIKGLWVIATNTAHSWINQNEFKKIREKLDFLVVQDMYHSTETAQIADLILPAAGWGEKEGTLINSERRIGVLKKVAKAPGQALADFSIFKLVAHFWGCADLFKKWENPEAVFNILKTLSKGQPCDISGIDNYAMIDRSGGIQWPYPEGTESAEKQRRLFEDGRFYHPHGKAVFHFEEPKTMPEPADKEFPLILLSGRGTSSQWHTQTRTGKSDVLRKLYPRDLYIEINAVDAQSLGIAPNEVVKVRSRRGEVRATAFITQTVEPGQIFIPMHYATANQLTHPTFDPYSAQPSYKACAVKVEKI